MIHPAGIALSVYSDAVQLPYPSRVFPSDLCWICNPSRVAPFNLIRIKTGSQSGFAAAGNQSRKGALCVSRL